MSSEIRPFACAVIGRTRHKMMQAEIREAGKQGAKLIELRLDYLAKAPDFKRLLENRPCPMIATFRRHEDGGRWSGTELDRHTLMRQAVVAGFDYLDVEVDIADQIPRFGKVKRIVSYHNLREVPAKLELIYEQMCEEDADIIKVCVTAQKPADNLRVLNLLKKPIKPTIAFCMGDMGTCSRLLGLRMGMPFTYGAFNRERQIVPGMLTFHDLKKAYFVDHITPETRVFGVIGDPVSHSLSPLIHNAAMHAIGYNGMYLPFQVPRGELTHFLRQYQDVPVTGYSVTLPHKEAAARVQIKDPSVTLMGTANTLMMTEFGFTTTTSDVKTEVGFSAYNTDAQAAIDSLKVHLPVGADDKKSTLGERYVMILGAGGVARAIAFALQKEGAAVIVTNRTEERGAKLAADVGCKFVDWSARHNVVCDTLINCTSVGMHPNMDDSPIHHSFLKPGLMVFETIYTPETTLLVREARERGCHVLTGIDMFVRQAGLQFKIFTGEEAPLEMMDKLVRRTLSPLSTPREEEKSEPE